MRFLDRLQTRLNIAFLLLAVIPLLITGIIIGQRSSAYLQQNAHTNLQNEADHIAVEIGSFINSYTSTLRLVITAHGLPDAEQTTILNGLLALDTAFQQISVLDANGQVIERVSRAGSPLPGEASDQSDNPAFTVLRDTTLDFYYSDVRVADDQLEPLMSIAAAVRDPETGALVKVLLVDFRFRAIWDLLAARDYRPGESAYLLNDAGVLVAHANPALIERSLSAAPPRGGENFTLALDNPAVLYATQQVQIGSRQFTAVVEQTTAEALALAQDIQVVTGVVLLAALVAVVVLTVLVVRYIVQPIDRLTSVTEQIAQGDLKQRAEVSGRSEIDILAGSINSMADQLSQSINDLEQRLHDIEARDEALARSEERHRLLSENAQDLIYRIRLKPDMAFEYVSPSATRMTGYTPDDHYTDPHLGYKLVHPDDRHLLEAAVIQPDKPIVLRWVRKDGSVLWTEQVNTPIMNAHGEVVALEGIARDITERKQMEEYLRQAEERYRTMADLSTDWTYWQKPDGSIQYVSPSCRQITGYPPEEFQRNPSLVFQRILDDDRDIWQAHKHTANHDERPQMIQYRLLHRDGSVRWIEHTCRPVFDINGDFDGYRVSNADITRRKQAEEDLHHNVQHLKLTIMGTRAGTWEWNILTGETVFNERWAEIIGCTLDELAPTTIATWIDHSHPDDLAESNRRLQAHFAGETEYYECETRMRHKDGHWVWVLDRGRVLEWTESGQPLRMFGTHVNITQRRHAEDQLRQNEAFVAGILRAVPSFIYIYDFIEDHNVFANDGLTVLLGYTPAELQAMGSNAIPVLVHPDDINALRASIQRVRAMTSGEGWYQSIYRLKHKDGSWRWIQDQGVIYQRTAAGAVRQILGAAIDINAQKQAEADLRETQDRYQTLTELTFEGVALHDKGVILDANPAFARMFGYTVDELIGQQVIELLFTPESAKRVREQVQRQYAEPYEAEGRRKDGSTFPVELEARQLRPDLRVAAVRDITQRKQAEAYGLEIERLKTRFQQEQERSELIQRIIAALSHDLRTALAVISSSRDMLSYYYDRISDEDRQERLDTIGRQVQFALNLLEETVQMARGNLHEDEFRPAPVNLGALCRVSVEAIRSADGSHRLVFDNIGQIETVCIDEILVSRILLNLLGNAIKYSPPGSEVRLSLDSLDAWVRLSVQDEGKGISTNDIEHIFEPFYRAESAKPLPGTGLGLSIVKNCVDRHRGRIEVSSEPGQGTVFTVELPGTC